MAAQLMTPTFKLVSSLHVSARVLSLDADMSLVSPVVNNADANEPEDRSGAHDDVSHWQTSGTSHFTCFSLVDFPSLAAIIRAPTALGVTPGQHHRGGPSPLQVDQNHGPAGGSALGGVGNQNIFNNHFYASLSGALANSSNQSR